jgi:hypothetical protein
MSNHHHHHHHYHDYHHHHHHHHNYLSLSMRCVFLGRNSSRGTRAITNFTKGGVTTALVEDGATAALDFAAAFPFETDADAA